MRILILMAMIGLSACAPKETVFFGTKPVSFDSFRGLQLRAAPIVVDEANQPIAGAKVLIGKKVDSPFIGNFLTSGNDGSFSVPSAWTTPQDVTIEAPGFVRTTFVKAVPARLTYKLSSDPGREKLEAAGPTTNWEKLKKDNIVDFGLILPLASKRGIFNFNVPDLLSPEVDQISAYGQTLLVPSNFSIPKQTENYGIIPVTVEKVDFRSYVRKPWDYTFYAAKGKFPFKTVTQQLEAGKNYYDVLNSIEFMGGGLTTAKMSAQKSKVSIDISPMKFQPVISATSKVVPNGMIQLMAIWNEENGQYFPSDVKGFNSNETLSLKAPSGRKQMALSIQGKTHELKSRMITLEEQMSRALIPLNGTSFNPNHLDVITPPTFNGVSVSANPPSSTGFEPAGSYMILYDVDVTDTADSFYEQKTPLWEIYADSWMGQYDLPEWPAAVGQSKIKRFEVGYLATESNPGVVVTGPEMLTSATHVSKNAVDF